MFDIGFFELMVIGVIALLVLGPERLPHAVRMTGAWIGKFRRAATSVREELEREVNAYEMQQRIKEQLEQSGVSETRDVLEKTRQTLRNGILDDKTLKEIDQRGLNDYAKALTEIEADVPDGSLEQNAESDEEIPESKKIRERNRQQTAIGTAGNPPPGSPAAASAEPAEKTTAETTDNTAATPEVNSDKPHSSSTRESR